MIDIKKFKPKVKGKSDKFSWNLYKWLKANPNHYRIYKSTWCPVMGIVEKPDRYYIGYRDGQSKWVSAIMLMRVCCGQKQSAAYGGAHGTDDWIDITDEFYKEYEEKGVCAIPDYNNHNWENHGLTKRKCLNCGRVEKRETVRISQKVWKEVKK